MSISGKARLLSAVALLVMPSLASAQRLQAGTWTGTVTPPSGPIVDATFEVAESGDSVTIVLKVEFGDFPFSNIRIAEDRLMFRFEPDTSVDCTLMLQEDGSYSGDCIDSNGEKGVIVMRPPAKTPEGGPAEIGRP